MTDALGIGGWPTFFTVAILVGTLVLLSRGSASTPLIVLLLAFCLVGLGVRVYDLYSLTER